VSRVSFIGTSDAFGAGGRRQAAIFVETASGGLLLDCAPTTGSGLVALGIERLAVDAVALSHFHGDHFAGLPQLLLASIYEDERRKPLWIGGPAGVEERVWAAATALGHDFRGQKLPFPLHFVELAPERAVELGPVRVEAFAAHHQPESQPQGLRLAVGRRRLVYTGDTGWFDGLPAALRGADLCICECNFYEPEFEYHLDYRTLLSRAPELACERLVLTHLGTEMSARRGQLELETADDGLVLSL